MAKLFNEKQMSDPWGWCMEVIERHGLTSKQVSTQVQAPWSTVRALLSGHNKAPRYNLLQDVIALCIRYENGEGAVAEVTDEPVVEESGDEVYDFI